MFAGLKAQFSQLVVDIPGRLSETAVTFHGYLTAQYGPVTAWAVYLGRGRVNGARALAAG